MQIRKDCLPQKEDHFGNCVFGCVRWKPLLPSKLSYQETARAQLRLPSSTHARARMHARLRARPQGSACCYRMLCERPRDGTYLMFPELSTFHFYFLSFFLFFFLYFFPFFNSFFFFSFSLALVSFRTFFLLFDISFISCGRSFTLCEGKNWRMNEWVKTCKTV